MRQVLTIEGNPEKVIGIIETLSENIKGSFRGNYDSGPTSGMSRKGIAGCWFGGKNGLEGVD